MEDQLITFETAKLAKEKGFKNGIHYNGMGEYFTNTTQSLLQKWLREVHSIDVVIGPERYKTGVNYMVQAQKWDLSVDEDSHYNFVVKGSYWFNDNNEYPTYEDALEKGLQEALKLIE